jgi:hypothetical protein
MTALSMTARPGEDDARLQPVPWRRMAGVTWRQHRVALIGVAVLLGALAVYLWVAGASLHHAYDAAVVCHPESSAACQGLDNTVSGMDNFLSNGYMLQVLPVLIGAFVEAPVLAREMETGTFRYAWTQGFGRRRWAVAKLALLAVVVTAAGGAFGALLTWYYQPFLSDNQFLELPKTTPFAPGLFDLRGVGFPAWTLAAFAIGALAGMLIRRVVPAIVATLVVYVGLAFAAAGFLREHYLAPLVVTNYSNVPSNAWTVGQWWTKDGRFAFGDYPPASILNQFCPPTSAPKGGGPSEGWGPCLVQHGYTMWTSYQPTSRFWPFQWIEGGWLLALSLLLITAAIWLVHRRAA